ncbi:MAG: hypothetical protein ACE5O2_01400 [Armatimonadota bacterium]
MTTRAIRATMLTAGLLVGLSASAEDAPAKKPRRSKDEVFNALKRYRATVDERITVALRRIGEKNFLAARSAADDAADAAKRLRERLPWQHMFHQLDVAVDAMRTRSWGNAKDAVDAAAAELDLLANFMQVERARQSLGKCKEAMDEHNRDLARQRIREVKKMVAVQDIAGPLRHTHAYLQKARKNLTSLPLFIKGKRKEARRNLERGREELADVWPLIEDYMNGKMKDRLPRK